MAGILPSTAFLLVRNNIVVDEFASLTSIAYHLGISIDDKGVITFMGEKQHPSYSLEYSEWTARNGWKKDEAIRDWAKCHMKLPSEYRIYQFLT